MTTPASYPPPDQQQWWPATVQVPAQRQASPAPPETTPPHRHRWPWALGGLTVGLLVGAAVGGLGAAGRDTATAAGAAPATTPATVTRTAPGEIVYVTVPAPAPETTAPTPFVPAGPLTSFSNGTYEVGPDVVPGKYKTPGPGSGDIMDSCYMEVSDGSGSVGGIDQNDNLTGPGVVTLKPGKYFTTRGGCTWTKAG